MSAFTRFAVFNAVLEKEIQFRESNLVGEETARQFSGKIKKNIIKNVVNDETEICIINLKCKLVLTRKKQIHISTQKLFY